MTEITTMDCLFYFLYYTSLTSMVQVSSSIIANSYYPIVCSTILKLNASVMVVVKGFGKILAGCHEEAAGAHEEFVGHDQPETVLVVAVAVEPLPVDLAVVIVAAQLGKDSEVVVHKVASEDFELVSGISVVLTEAPT